MPGFARKKEKSDDGGMPGLAELARLISESATPGELAAALLAI